MFTVEKTTVKAKTRKLKANWTMLSPATDVTPIDTLKKMTNEIAREDVTHLSLPTYEQFLEWYYVVQTGTMFPMYYMEDPQQVINWCNDHCQGRFHIVDESDYFDETYLKSRFKEIIGAHLHPEDFEIRWIEEFPRKPSHRGFHASQLYFVFLDPKDAMFFKLTWVGQ